MTIKKNIVLEKEGNKPILVDFFYNSSNNKMPVIIFCHGYKGYKDWGAWNLVAKEFANNNFFFLKFNFSHNGGTVENPIDFPDLNAFGNNNFTHELNDIERVLSFISENTEFSKNIDLTNIFLIGHSRGGGLCAIKASENKQIKGLITWAGVSNFKIRFNEGSQEFKEWKDKGVKYVENKRTKQQMPHFFQFYLDFKENEKRFNIQSAVQSLKIPFLVIHGDNDKSVLQNEGRDLHSWNKNSKFFSVKNGTHTFSSMHPWQELKLPKGLQLVTETSINFIKSFI
ncbi:alpha/beta hydrolase fold domain-containing protein [Flavobacteriaceae bacterium]|nr:alpha/beta hydrolase fold domain-containing protein [Flavobacteriaceae bacterium]